MNAAKGIAARNPSRAKRGGISESGAEDADVREKDMQRFEIERHVQEYLARGGKIHQVDFTENKSYRDPRKRTRKQHTAHLKKFNKVSKRAS